MLIYIVLALMTLQSAVADEPMDLKRVQRGALYIRLPARKFLTAWVERY